MADATLNDVVKRLRTDNAQLLQEQKNTTGSINTLVATMTRILEEQEAQALRDKEDAFEKRKVAAAPKQNDTGVSFGGKSRLLGLLPIAPIVALLNGVTSGLAAYASALEGLGPNGKDLRTFKKGIDTYKGLLSGFTKPVTAFGELVIKNFKKSLGLFENLIKGFSNPMTGFANRLVYASEDLSKTILRYFGIENTEKGRQNMFRNAQGRFEKLPKWREPFRNGINGILNIAQRMSTFFTNVGNTFKNSDAVKRFNDFFGRQASADPRGETAPKQSKASKLVESLKSSKWINGFLKVLRPIAVVLSAFDGLRNAQIEMEQYTQDEVAQKWISGGVGGFISGGLASFFGEFANFIKDIPLNIIKWLVPADWLNEDGTFNTKTNFITWAFSGLEKLDFAQMIRDIVQAPFDGLGGALDFVRNLVGAKGTDAEKQAQAKKVWNDWWSNWSSLEGGVSNSIGILEWLINTAFHPIDVILRSVMDAFGADESLTEKSDGFLERIYKIADYVFNLIPSVEDIKKSLAAKLPTNISEFLGLSDYVPLSNEYVSGKVSELDEQFDTDAATYQRLLEQAKKRQERFLASGGTDPTKDPYFMSATRDLDKRLEGARIAMEESKAELDAFIARANTSGSGDFTQIQNISQQNEAIVMQTTSALADVNSFYDTRLRTQW